MTNPEQDCAEVVCAPRKTALGLDIKALGSRNLGLGLGPIVTQKTDYLCGAVTVLELVSQIPVVALRMRHSGDSHNYRLPLGFRIQK